MDTASILYAIEFATRKHHGQMRSGTDFPYIVHPLDVARLLVEHGVDDTVTIQAAILHDVIEDTDATYEELVGKFGADVADVVMEVSDDPTLSKKEAREKVIAEAPTMSLRARLVKLADSTSNVSATDLECPADWSNPLKHAYIKTSVRVTEGTRGANAALADRFDREVEEARARIPKKLSITAEHRLPLVTWMVRTGTRPETLAHVAGVGLATVQRARRGRPLTLRTAEAISGATGGAVTTMALLRGQEQGSEDVAR